jgi:hypothetical protein
MYESLLLDNSTPTTQSAETVKQLIAYVNGGQAPKELPPAYKMTDELVLVLSNKKDSFYVTTPKTCSCPSFVYRGGPCKHQRKFFPDSKPGCQTLAETLAEHDRNLHKMPKSYQRMVRAAREDAEAEPLESIHKGGFRPILPDEEV